MFVDDVYIYSPYSTLKKLVYSLSTLSELTVWVSLSQLHISGIFSDVVIEIPRQIYRSEPVSFIIFGQGASKTAMVREKAS